MKIRRLLTPAATIIFTAAFIWLGFWQLQRARDQQQHTQLMHTLASRRALPAIRLSQLHDPDALPVSIKGHFDNAHSFLLDNQFRQNQLGYNVITPFKTDNDLWLLVNRGWLPVDPQRGTIHPTPIVSGHITLRGISHRPRHNIFLPSQSTSPAQPWPRHIVGVDLQAAAQQLGKPLARFVLRLDKHQAFTENSVFLRHWQPATRMTAMRHRIYAIQWFIFAAIATGVYLVLSWRRFRRSR